MSSKSGLPASVLHSKSLSPTAPSYSHNVVEVAQGEPAILQVYLLVLEAMGIAAWLDEHGGVLLVQEELAEEASRQLQLYQLENVNWPPVDTTIEHHFQVLPTAPILGAMVLFFLVSGTLTDANPWFQQGGVDSQAILVRGEWWRLITAMTLHVDTVHLLGNCCLGGLLIHLLSSRLGYGLAWFSLLCCGVSGNWLNIVWRQQAHYSVGFSTAVFAVIGLFAGLQALRKKKLAGKELFLSLGAGLALLALLGTEGQRTDLGSHFFVFLVGFVVGIPLGSDRWLKWSRSDLVQGLLFTMAMTTVASSWYFALH
jgi:membrane associated rhomboid family serine protease